MSKMKSGCIAKHLPSGETWVVLGVSKERNEVCTAGWPQTIERLSEMEWVSDHELTEEELVWRNRTYGSNWDPS